MLDLIEKLITEHGSSTILRERLKLISDKYNLLEEKNAQLTSRNSELESQLEIAREEILQLKSYLEKNAKSNSEKTLGENEIQILNFLFENNQQCRIEQIANFIQTDPNTAKYHINNLLDSKYVYNLIRMGGPTTYKISNDGIKYVVESKNT